MAGLCPRGHLWAPLDRRGNQRCLKCRVVWPALKPEPGVFGFSRAVKPRAPRGSAGAALSRLAVKLRPKPKKSFYCPDCTEKIRRRAMESAK